jgi:galactose mutarotase-like enzyme
MIYKLENDHLLVSIHAKGSELASIQSKKNGLEYLWQADPVVWNRHAPVLFPIVGKLRNDEYEWQGQMYRLPQHGFARDHHFEIHSKQADSLTLTLMANQDTLALYPFRFELRITHALEANRLEVKYEVINQGEGPMPFSIGAHPGFACPLRPDETFEDYYLEFDQPETLSRHLLENGLFNGRTEPLLLHEKTLPLHPELFEKDAIVVTGYRSESLTLKSRKGPHQLKVNFPGFPWLGIWTKNAKSPFVCIEPWYGHADLTQASGKLMEKAGIILLNTGEEFNCRHTIEIS